MATDFLPFDEWVAGTLQNSVPANSNALRSEAVIANVISDTLAAQPVSPVDGDCYIIPAAATGTQWATFAEGSLAYFRAGTWYEFSAFEGLLKVVAGEIQIYSGTTWVPYAGGSAGSDGGGTLRDTVAALTISSGVVNIDCALGDFFTLALTANVTSITFTNLPAAGKGVSLALRATQDGTGGRTVALPAAFKATTGSDTAVQSAANARTLITLTTFDQGTRWEYTMRGVAA